MTLYKAPPLVLPTSAVNTCFVALATNTHTHFPIVDYIFNRRTKSIINIDIVIGHHTQTAHSHFRRLGNFNPVIGFILPPSSTSPPNFGSVPRRLFATHLPPSLSHVYHPALEVASDTVYWRY